MKDEISGEEIKRIPYQRLQEVSGFMWGIMWFGSLLGSMPIILLCADGGYKLLAIIPLIMCMFSASCLE